MGRYAIIVVMALILILSYFVISSTRTSTISSERNVESFHLSAGKNIANSAAQIAVKNIKDGTWTVANGTEQYFTTGTDNFQASNTLGGRYKIKIRNDNDVYTVSATGIGGLTNNEYAKPYEVTVKLSVTAEQGTATTPSLPPFDHAVFSKGSLKLTSGTVDGNVGSNSISPGGISLDWGIILNGDISIGPSGDPSKVVVTPAWSNLIHGSITNLTETRNYQLPPFPDYPGGLPNRGNFTTPQEKPYSINADGYYNNFEIIADRKVTIDLGGGDRIIRVKTLNILQGHIEVSNIGANGRLFLYIEDKFVLNGDSSINKGGQPDRVQMYYSGTTSINSGGNTRVRASIYVQKADIYMGGSAGALGNIISGGEKIEISGGASISADAKKIVSVLYAPQANVVIRGGGYVNGAIIAESVEVSGGGKIEYSGIFEDSIPDLEDIEPEEDESSSSEEIVTGIQILQWN
ncbi:MAG: hypothetical protein WCX83_03145 [Candidatus Cloacimonas sp.]|nr:DUF2807 domain-containing protein [Candidatus Cloacimonadota bacterium]